MTVTFPRPAAAVRDPAGDTVATRHAFLPALTGIRSLAAFWVVSYHLLPQMQALFPGTVYALYHSVAGVGYLGVDVFFILSGFILTLNYEGRLERAEHHGREVWKFLWARFARIYPVHLFTLLLLVPAALALRHLHATVEPGRFTVSGFVANLFLVQAWRLDTIPHLNWNTPSWSVSCEWLAYLLFPLLLVALAGVRRLPAQVAGIAALLLAVPALIYVTGEHWHFGIADHFIRIAAEFVAGMLLYRVYRADAGSRWNWTVISLVTLAATYAGTLLLIRAGYENFAYILIPLFAPMLYALARQRNAWARLMARRGFVYWGAASYSLYMTHNLWLMVLKAAAPAERFAGSGTVTRLGVLLLYVLPLFLIAALTFHFVEEPARKVLNRLVRPRPSRT